MMIMEDHITHTFRWRFKDLDLCLRQAVTRKLTGFKLYDLNGCFLHEYALFDGKFREVLNKEIQDGAIRTSP